MPFHFLGAIFLASVKHNTCKNVLGNEKLHKKEQLSKSDYAEMFPSLWLHCRQIIVFIHSHYCFIRKAAAGSDYFLEGI